ncbi:MAG: hypothetical protein QOI41_599 [Myxococcales bacterium]|nr:hypothetical protein [Myxococcales bacterium]
MSAALSYAIQHALEMSLYVSTVAVALLCLGSGIMGLGGSPRAHLA